MMGRRIHLEKVFGVENFLNHGLQITKILGTTFEFIKVRMKSNCQNPTVQAIVI
jgi:hypothetical protein